MVWFNLLGELRLEIDGRDVELPASRKARLLLAMLALERRAHGRSELAGRLGPDVREDSARASLRNAFAQLRGALGQQAGSVVWTERGEAIAIAHSATRISPGSTGSATAGMVEYRATTAKQVSGVRDEGALLVVRLKSLRRETTTLASPERG
jgi:DNA-binding SARP family transcriptional activator